MKIIKGSLAFTLALLISVSLTSGLQLTALTGSNGGSSSTSVVYGATVTDYADQQIGLNPTTLAATSSISGSGTLPFSSLTINDANGNFASVSRSVYGISGVTTWNYEWQTYFPYSATVGYGVGAWLKLTASKATQIYGKGYASNREGDVAQAYMTVGTTSGSAVSSINSYSINPTAFTNEARVYQDAVSASSTYPIVVYGASNNNDGDSTVASIYMNKGTIDTPKTNVYAGKTSCWSYPSASSIDTTGYSKLYAYASNSEDDSSRFDLYLSNGKISAPYFYGWSGTQTTTTSTTKYAETWGKVYNAYGTTVLINTVGLDKAVGYQDGWVSSSSGWTKTKVERGEGYFAAQKTNNNQFGTVSVKTRSTKSDVVISTEGFGTKTALYLDPLYWKYVTSYGAADVKDDVVDSLLKKGYAVTYYRDSAVSKDKVKQMDEYKVSAIHTDTTTDTLTLSKSTDGTNADTMTAADLKAAYTNNNGMAIVFGSNSFTSTAANTWADAVSNAEVRGGATNIWGIAFSQSFIKKYFTAMGYGYSAYYANEYAKGTGTSKLRLLGNTGFTL